MTMSRRDAAKAALALAVASGIPTTAEAKTKGGNKGPRPAADGKYWTEKKSERIAMLLFPGMTAFDVIGPHYYLQTMRGAKADFVWKTRDPVLCDRNVTLTPTATFDEIGDDLDLLFIPGGSATTVDAADDDQILEFLATRGKTARYIGSVCTGCIIAGTAGLLNGYRATGHWKVRDECLPAMGATPINARIVEDRNRITAAGPTAGIDFGLHMVEKFRGPDLARTIQLVSEYSPEPRYDVGTPEKAWPETHNLVRGLLPEFNRRAIEIGNRRRPSWTA